MPSTVTIRVRAPASTANLGSAFDAMAMAMALYNEVTATEADADLVTVEGEGAAALARGTPNLLSKTLDHFFSIIGRTRPPLALHLTNTVPFGRGLGSSSAAIAAGLRLGEALSGVALPESDLVSIAARLEGHGDNTTAALLGGCTICVSGAAGFVYTRITIPPELRMVLFIPDYVVATEHARAALPPQVPRADAVFNTGRAALLAAALTTGRLALLGVAMEDRLHQPYRFPLYQDMPTLLQGALAAGAFGAAVSGAGPSAVAITNDDGSQRVANAFADVAKERHIAGNVRILQVDLEGAHVVT